MSTLNEVMEKWAPVLDDEQIVAECGPLTGERRRVTAVVMENTIREQQKAAAALNEATPASNTSNVANYDPVIVGLLRRSMPKLIAYDFAGVQPMTLPTGLVFAARHRYTSKTGPEALFNEPDPSFSAGGNTTAAAGTNPVDSVDGLDPWDSTPSFTNPSGVTTAEGEDFGGATTLNEMTFTVEKHTVTAVERGLQAGYTVELAQDLKAVHGLDAETELSNLLANQIIADINREIVRTLYKIAKTGAETTATPGTFDLDVDANGRWSVERFKGLMFQIEREANRIAQTTRMGRGNVLLVSADVASALAMTGKLDVGGLKEGEMLNVDDSGATFVGILNNKYKVFIDPYMGNGDANQFVVVGYKGQDLGRAGLFYCPYVPLSKHTSMNYNTFQPRIAFKTRYALAGNPMNGNNAANTTPAFTLAPKSNAFFRLMRVTNIA